MAFSVLAVFMSAFVLDLLYVLWFHAIETKRVFQGVVSSMLLGACGLYGTVSAVGNRWLAIPYLLGLGAGTALGIFVKKDCRGDKR